MGPVLDTNTTRPASCNPGCGKPAHATGVSGRVALEANQMGYEVGLRINTDVLNTQQQLFITRRDLMRAQVDAMVATLRLKTSAGGLVETEIQELTRWLK